MTNQEQLSNIVASGNELAILPFLKKLSTKERKALASSLKDLYSFYHEHIKVSEDKWGRRATQSQTKILDIAAYLCFGMADYRKRVFGLKAELIDNLLDDYQPKWLGKYINSLVRNNWAPHNLSYLWLLKLQKRGVLNPAPALLVRQLCLAIGERSASYNYVYVPENLTKYKETLQDHFWLLFQYETTIYNSFRWRELEAEKKIYSWIDTIVQLVVDGQLPRKKILQETLRASTQDFNRSLIGWYMDLFLALAPSTEELIDLQKDLFNTFYASQSKPITTALKLIKKIAKEPDFDTEGFLENSTQLLTSETKSIVNSTLMVLDKLARKSEEARGAIMNSCSNAFLNTDVTIQTRAAKLIIKYGAPCKEAISKELSMYVDNLKAAPKALLKDFVEEKSVIQEVKIESVKKVWIAEENALPMPQNIDDVIFLLSEALDGNAPWHFDMVLAALLKFNQEMTVETVNKFAPVFQRAYKLLNGGGWNTRTGHTDHLLAIFLCEYLSFLISKFKSADQLVAVKNKESNEGTNWRWFTTNFTRLANWNIRSNTTLFIPLKRLAIHALNQIKSANSLPLLSTPTHDPCWIDPSIFVKRLALYQILDSTPNATDWHIAIARVNLEDTQEAIDIAKEMLKGEYLTMTLFLLDPTALPTKVEKYPEEWLMCAYTKNPSHYYKEFAAFAPNEVDQKILVGEVPFHLHSGPKMVSRYNYKNRKYEEVEIVTKNIIIKEPQRKASFLQKVMGVLIAKKKRVGIIPQFLNFTPSWLSLQGQDVNRLCSLTPNNLQPFIATMSKALLHQPASWGQSGKKQTIATTQALLTFWKSGNINNLFLSSALFCKDKTVRILAAEIWLKGVSEGTVDVTAIGSICGKMATLNFFPFKRLLDTMADQIFQVSPTHDKALKLFIESLIKELPYTPLRHTKKLLEMYQELKLVEATSISDPSVSAKLTSWQETNSLKKLSTQLIEQSVAA